MSTTLPDHLRTLGGQLDEAWMHRYGAPPRRKSVARAKLVAASVVLAGAAALAVALFGRTTGPGAVEQALAAVGSAPGGTIVHLTSISRDDRGVIVERAELWGTTTPPFARRWILRAGDGEPIEQGARADEYTQYDPAGIVYVRTLDGGIAEGTRPADFAADAARLKSYLRDGHARDAGEVTVDGTIRRRFVITPPGGGTCTYDVQPQTFVGVSLTCAGTPSGRTDQTWEYLPRAGNERLLSVTGQHPSARVDRAPIGPCGPERHTARTPPCVVSSPGA